MISFLREIFLPTKYKDYFLFPCAFLGIELSKDTMYGVRLVAKGTKRTLEKTVVKTIEDVEEKQKKEQRVEIFSALVKELGDRQEVVIALQNQGIIFKELSVPFVDREKIRAILPFEVEPLIPFAKESAIIEFIQTKVDIQSGISDLCIAIIPEQNVVMLKELLDRAGIVSARVTIRAFLLASLYTHTSLLTSDEQVVIDFEKDYCTLLIFSQKQLRLVRVLNYSIATLARQIAETLKQSEADIESSLFQASELLPEAAKEQYIQGMKKFVHDVTFTIRSIIPEVKSLHLSILHKETEPKALLVLLARALSAKEQPVLFKTALSQLHIEEIQKMNHRFLIPTLAALPLASTEDTNVLRDREQKSAKNIFIKQVATAAIITLTLFVFMFFSYRNSLQVLQDEIALSEKEIIQSLRSEFDIPAEEKTVDDVLDYAAREGKNKQNMWLAFSNHARAALLHYLLDLTERINQDALGFVLERLTFDQTKIVIKAEVRDYEALKILERELRQSKLFSYIEPQDNPRFTMTIHLLPLGEQK